MLLLKIKNKISSMVEKVINLDSIVAKRCNRYILAYHRIIPYEIVQKEYVQDSIWTLPETFENQIKWMLEIGEIVDIERILDFEKENDKPLFSITFDDGWKDNYEYAFPILKKYGITATIFIVTSAVDTGRLPWVEEVLKKTHIALKNNKKQEIIKFIKRRLGDSMLLLFNNIYELVDHYLEYLKELSLTKRENCIYDYYTQIGVDFEPIRDSILTWDEILEMDKHGISFGSHTHTHAILQYCDEKTILNELLISKNILEEKLKKPIYIFCYPNARYNNSDANLLEKAGYKFGFRLHNLPLNKGYSRYFIPRILVNEKKCGTPSYFKFRLLGVPKY